MGYGARNHAAGRLTPDPDKQAERNPYPAPTHGEFALLQTHLEGIISNAFDSLRGDIQDIAAGLQRQEIALTSLVDWKHTLEVQDATFRATTEQRLAELEKRVDDGEAHDDTAVNRAQSILLGLFSAAVTIALYLWIHH